MARQMRTSVAVVAVLAVLLGLGWLPSAGAATGSYTVTYSANGADYGSAPVDPASPYASGATVTVLRNTGYLAQAGAVFDGWNTAPDGSGLDYQPGATFAMPTQSVTLYAQWDPYLPELAAAQQLFQGLVDGVTPPLGARGRALVGDGSRDTIIGWAVSAIGKVSGFVSDQEKAAQMQQILGDLQNISNQLSAIENQLTALSQQIAELSEQLAITECTLQTAANYPPLSTMQSALSDYDTLLDQAITANPTGTPPSYPPTQASLLTWATQYTTQGVTLQEAYDQISSDMLGTTGTTGALRTCGAALWTAWQATYGAQVPPLMWETGTATIQGYYQLFYTYVAYWYGVQVQLLALDVEAQHLQAFNAAGSAAPANAVDVPQVCFTPANGQTETYCNLALVAMDTVYDQLGAWLSFVGAPYAWNGLGTRNQSLKSGGAPLLWLGDINDFPAPGCTLPLSSDPTDANGGNCGPLVGNTPDLPDFGPYTGWQAASATQWGQLLAASGQLPVTGPTIFVGPQDLPVSSALAGAGLGDAAQWGTGAGLQSLIVNTGQTYAVTGWPNGTNPGPLQALCFLDTDFSFHVTGMTIDEKTQLPATEYVQGFFCPIAGQYQVTVGGGPVPVPEYPVTIAFASASMWSNDYGPTQPGSIGGLCANESASPWLTSNPYTPMPDNSDLWPFGSWAYSDADTGQSGSPSRWYDCQLSQSGLDGVYAVFAPNDYGAAPGWAASGFLLKSNEYYPVTAGDSYRWPVVQITGSDCTQGMSLTSLHGMQGAPQTMCGQDFQNWLANQLPSQPPAPPPAVTGVDPVFGPTSGGTTVTISGIGFVDGAGLSVAFGSTPARSMTWVSSSELTAVTPANAAGVVSVTVTNPGGLSDTLPNAFTYSGGPGPAPGPAPTSSPTATPTATPMPSGSPPALAVRVITPINGRPISAGGRFTVTAHLDGLPRSARVGTPVEVHLTLNGRSTQRVAPDVDGFARFTGVPARPGTYAVRVGGPDSPVVSAGFSLDVKPFGIVSTTYGSDRLTFTVATGTFSPGTPITLTRNGASHHNQARVRSRGAPVTITVPRGTGVYQVRVNSRQGPVFGTTPAVVR